jgi:Glycosyl transferase family 2
MRLAAVTMVYNEPDYIDLWCRHYGAQLGPEHCYVIDHGSDDGTTDNLRPVNVIRIPRSPKDNDARARWISDFCAGLLAGYDAVIHIDVDEVLVADPRHRRNLRDCASMMTSPVMHAIGLEVCHLPESEPAIEIARPISLQRDWTWFNSGLCKPVMIRKPFDWAPGFHSVAAPVAFDHLYLFHLRYFDLERGLRRLAQTRSMPWAREDAGPHQRFSDDDWRRQLQRIIRREKAVGAEIEANCDPLASLLAQVVASQEGRETALYRTSFDIRSKALLPIPPRFKGLF